jgi:hypothetical protein
MEPMRRVLPLTICLLLAAAPALAQQRTDAPDPALEAVARRIEQLVAALDAAQFKDAEALPPDRSFTVGEYPARVDFLLLWPGWIRLTLIPDVLDASGSSFMGLWFLSQAHRFLGDVQGEDTASLRESILRQLQRASELPRFFQGSSGDVLGCPPETMGWYPLVAGHRLPALLPDLIEYLLPLTTRRELANLSDGDIWAWCMAIDDATPGILEYRHEITAGDAFAPLLGSWQRWEEIDPVSQQLYRAVRGDSPPRRLPIGTFYATSTEKPQHFSTVVMANILASIPLLPEVPGAYLGDLQAAASFVDDATRRALAGELSWELYAYDYYTIDVAPIAYVARAHSRIAEIDRPGYPTLLARSTVTAAARFIADEAVRRIELADLHAPGGARDYASLVYAFDAMMHLRRLDRDLFDDELVRLVAERLLVANPASYSVPGTGPYPLGGPIWADMASICFVAAPLVEAFSLYLLEHDPGSAASRAPGAGISRGPRPSARRSVEGDRGSAAPAKTVRAGEPR